MATALGFIHALQAHEPIAIFAEHNLLAVGTTVVGLALLTWFGFSRKPVEFGEANAIDVESMGLYWHFVDIVWIVIFTAVYLLEYL